MSTELFEESDGLFQIDTKADIYDPETGEATYRVCSVCGNLLPIDQFYKNGTTVHGRPRRRRDCQFCHRSTQMALRGVAKHD